ncbi:hypothetical protein ACRE_037550 [Hapsidospora chrysogenum ATCC 11550]|uniref:Uncharacterized protein n=1 Tax=Hapsidospora chrysogenum (strain ATCC 11550 / CBS 779.69 / DSM 880 / IAM 14645 / JCM 23072 / IMI 49137) TaxID=857340 RepID=A0A086T7X1_HAPC1|nr:hypothetical protein ACRE_037550 [Hapsidospora chrysogenum ATCC 11550]
MPPTGNPESEHRPGNPSPDEARLDVIKPPLPSLSFSRSREESIDIQLPHVIAGGLVAAFAANLADELGNELLTHYYLPDQRVRVNLDRVFDGLIADFTRQIWDELWDFYYAANSEHARQLSLLFEGPVRQLVLTLTSPELSRCVLDRIGPGLSHRRMTWTASATGIDLGLALQLVCRWWHHEQPARSPGGNPDDIARTIGHHTLSGNAFKDLVRRVRQTLYTPHYVRMHLMGSAIWEIVTKRPFPPPTDGFHVLQLRFECDPRQRIMDEGNVDIGSFPAIIGTAEKCLLTTISEYVGRHWPKCSRVTIPCLTEALKNATQAFQQGQPFMSMAFWDADGDPLAAVLSPGMRLAHIEVEEGVIRMTLSGRVLALIDTLQQMAWTCAELSSSPVPETVSECTMQVSSWDYKKDLTFVNCSMVHRPVPAGEGAAWLQQRRGAVIAPGFPVEDHLPLELM